MKVFVTGASGFVGSHLVDALLARGDRVWAFQRAAVDDGRRNLTLQIGDVLDRNAVHQALAQAQPDEVYHLAAQSLPQRSWTEPTLTFQVNVEGTINVLEALRGSSVASRVVVACSSAEYRTSVGGHSIDEDDPLEPASPYGASKVASDHVARLYAQRYGLHVVRARPFFMIGSRKIGDVSSDWARRIVEIERRGGGDLSVGNLEMIRDFLDVRDGVNALMMLAASGTPGGVYNVSSGTGWVLSDFLRLFIESARAPITVRADATLFRALDETTKIGNSHRLRSLGWSQRHDIPSSVEHLLEYWRAQARTGVNRGTSACRS